MLQKYALNKHETIIDPYEQKNIKTIYVNRLFC